MIGEMIREYRRLRKLNLKQLSAKWGMHYSMLAKIETGERIPSRKFVPNIAQSLSCDPVDLLALITQEKVTRALTGTDGISQIDPCFLSIDDLENLAIKARKRFLELTKKSNIELPADRERIADILLGLKVRYVESIKGPQEEKLFGGFFPQGDYYNGEDRIIVISNKLRNDDSSYASEETKTFHLFHEIGHALLHWNNDFAPLQLNLFTPKGPLFCSSGGEYKPLEFQANNFASAFLMPKEEILEAVGHSSSIDLKKFGSSLCRKFFVSRRTLEYRLRSLGIKCVNPQYF